MNANQQSGIGMTSLRTRQRLVNRLIDAGIKNLEVLDAIRETPRHLFVDEALASRAYEDTYLPIGHKQTISQPYIVARMTELLIRDGKPERVLELGTGSGYQTAVLARLVKQVYSTERIADLQFRARQVLKQLKIHNVFLQHSDGNYGWQREAPFDAIISTAAPEQIPKALLNQLKVGGRLVIPVGGEARRLVGVNEERPPGESQMLKLVIKTGEDSYDIQDIEEVVFVPLLSGIQS